MHTRWIITPALALVTTSLVATPALAGEISITEETKDHAEGEAEHHKHFFAGVNAMALAVVTPEKTKFAIGPGVFFEFTAVENWLEIEIATHYLNAEGVHEVPIDVLFKKPFHVNDWFHPHVGIGGVAVPIVEEEEAKVEGGLASVVGTYFWFAENAGWSVDVNYNLLFGSEEGHVHVTNEIGGTSGAVFGW